MRLYLMRHGEAEDPSINPDRGLTSEGKLAIEAIARKLIQKSVHPMQIYHSTKKRAQQTANITACIVATDTTPEAMDNLKPNDNPENIIDVINSWTDDTLLVSHLPFIPSLLNLLTGEKESILFTPGTVACLLHLGNKWELEWTINQ